MTPERGQYEVVYFNELGEHGKEKAIEDAIRGGYIYDGFLRHGDHQQGKQVVGKIVEELNQGMPANQTAIEDK